MARVCVVTGKKPMVGHHVSHANNKTKRRFLPNLQYRRFWLEGEKRWVRLRVTSAALRTIDKLGIEGEMAKGAREKIKLESSAGTGHFYTTTKNKRTTPDKLELLKFDPVVRKHVAYKETKLK